MKKLGCLIGTLLLIVSILLVSVFVAWLYYEANNYTPPSGTVMRWTTIAW